MKRSSTPAPPDPRETASAEAQFNRLDTYGPTGGGVRYGYTDGSGNFVQGQAPEDQQSAVKYLEGGTEGSIRRLLEPASVNFMQRIVSDNVDGLPAAPRVSDRSDIAGQIFNRNFSLMAPAIERTNESLITNLQGRGIPIGSEAYNDTYGAQLRETQDTLARMAMDADIAAGQEQSRQFGLDQSARSSAISEIIAAMGGGYSPQSPMPSGNAANVNYGGLIGQQYQQQLAAHNQQQQAKMGTAQAIGGLGAALIKSSVHAKHVHGFVQLDNIATAIQSIPVQLWTYKEGQRPTMDHGGHHIGPMAQDFHKITGLGRPDVIDLVDFNGVLLAALQSALARIESLECAVFEDEEQFERDPNPRWIN